MTRAFVLACLLFQTQVPPVPVQTPPVQTPPVQTPPVQTPPTQTPPPTTQAPPPAPTPPPLPSKPTIVAHLVESPAGGLNLIYEDDALLFASRAFGDRLEGGPQLEPALFVQSKEKRRWIQIVSASTLGAKLGRSWSDDPSVQKKLRTAPVSWDFIGLASKPYADLPLRTSASIVFPDLIVLDEPNDQYELHFFSVYNAATAETVFYVRRAELLNAFTRK